VRRLVLAEIPTADPLPTVQQPALVMRTRIEDPAGLQRAQASLPNGKFVEVLEHAHDLFEAAPQALAEQVGAFLSARV
jgi:pimeloyl-ACP methyl ester carboxylesterase